MVGPEVLFDGLVEVSNGQLYLTRDHSVVPTPELAFAGQDNGLCGAAEPGALYMRTGLQYGQVAFSVERYEQEPDIDEEWQDIVEASLVNPYDAMVLWNPEGDAWPMELPQGTYRVRYYASGMQAGWDMDINTGPTPVGRYRLAFWPGAPAGERIVRQGSEAAAYWHSTNGDGATSDVASDRLAMVGVSPGVVKVLGENLIKNLARADDRTLRVVARWAALQALSIARIRHLHILRPAVANLEQGKPVPPPFDDEIAVAGEPARLVPQTHVRPFPELFDEGEPPTREWAALVAVSATSYPDALEAALLAIVQATVAHGPDESANFLSGILREFPALRK